MKKRLIIFAMILSSFAAHATIHVMKVWDGYFQFVDAVSFGSDITIALGDTVQWLPLDYPLMVHTITSTNIPAGAASFDQIWQAPADTFFQYIPEVLGLYEYECTPHAVQFGMVGSIQVTEATTGIDTTDNLHIDLQVYPNPATTRLDIQGLPTSMPFRIFTLRGTEVMSGNTDVTIPISTLRAGCYIVEIIGDKPRRIQFVKQ